MKNLTRYLLFAVLGFGTGHVLAQEREPVSIITNATWAQYVSARSAAFFSCP